MVNVNPQTRFPLLQVEAMANAGIEKASGPDSFLSFLDKSLKQSSPAVQNRRSITDSGRKPIQSDRTVNNSTQKAEKAAVSGNTPVSSRQQPETQEEQKTLKVDESSKPAKETTGKVNSEKPKAVDTEPVDEAETPLPEQVEQSEQLLAIMDAIIATLQQAATSNGTAAEISENTEALPEAFPMRELKGMLDSLVETAEKLQGTKTSALALSFAKKLQQLLGEDSFEELMQQELEVSVTGVDPLKAIAGKMLQEAENTKLHLVQTSLTEITLPALERSETGVDPLNEPVIEGAEAETPESLDKAELETSMAEVNDNRTEAKSGQDKATFAEARQSPQPQPAVVDPLAYDTVKGISQETAPIETMKAQPALSNHVLTQVVEKAEMVVREDKSEMVMQLKPESLGKITLKVIHERGEVVARFVAENEQVKAILESNLQLLKDSLQKSGVAVQSLEVSVGQQGQEQQQRGWTGRQHEGPTEREIPQIKPLKGSQPYGYSRSIGDEYYTESSEIDLTA